MLKATMAITTPGATKVPERGSILVVDDDDAIRTVVRLILERGGYAVIDAPNGLIAQARALEYIPDLIILDWTMPVMNGPAAAQRLKSDPVTGAIPIVMLTTRDGVGDREAAFEAGVTAYLNKPITPSKLIENVREFIHPDPFLVAGL